PGPEPRRQRVRPVLRPARAQPDLHPPARANVGRRRRAVPACAPCRRRLHTGAAAGARRLPLEGRHHRHRTRDGRHRSHGPRRARAVPVDPPALQAHAGRHFTVRLAGALVGAASAASFSPSPCEGRGRLATVRAAPTAPSPTLPCLRRGGSQTLAAEAAPTTGLFLRLLLLLPLTFGAPP